MKNHWVHSLRFRFLLVNIAVLLAIFGLIIFNSNRVLKISAIENLHTTIRQTSETLNLAIVPHTTPEGLQTIEAYLGELVSDKESGIIYLALVDDQGRMLVGSQDVPDPLPTHEISVDQQWETGLVHVKQPILLDDNRVGGLFFGLSTQSGLMATKQIFRNNLLILSLGLIATIGILLVATLRVYNQVSRLMKASQALAVGKFSIRAPEAGKNELHHLGHNLNTMAEAVTQRTDALLQSQLKYRLLAQNSPDMIFRMSLDDAKILYVSPAAMSIFGHPPESWYNNSRLLEQCIHPDWNQYFADQFADIRKGKILPSYEYRIIQKNGNVRWVRQRNILEKDDSSRPVVVMGIITDITEQKHLEEELHDSDSRFLAMFEGAQDGIVFAHALTKQFINANPAFCSMVGYSNNELKEMSVVDIHCKTDWPEVKRRFEEQARGDLHLATDVPVLCKDGRIFPADISVFRLSISGQPCLAGFFRDITERKQAAREQARLNNELLQKQKMEALGQLTGGIAHDFNNILCIIQGHTELGLELCEQDDPGKLTEPLNRVKNAVDRAKDLVSRMLVFSRNQAQNNKPHQLGPLVLDDVKMLGAILPASISLNVEIEDNLPDVLMDPIRMNQLLMNLCVNARDALHGKGNITVSLHKIAGVNTECSACFQKVQGQWVELAIVDTGTGISPEVQMRMFEPYFTTKETGKGSGMGMAVVHGIMHSFAGSILVESEMGVGTSIRLLFPPFTGQKTEDSEISSPSCDSPSQGNGEHILVLDDEPDLAVFLERLLGSSGYLVTSFTDSEKAYAHFKENPEKFALLISDQTMPLLSGSELIKMMRKLRPGFPAILTSGFSDKLNDDFIASLDVHFLKKPYSSTEMLQGVEMLLQETEPD